MAGATGKKGKRQEAVRKGGAFMPGVGLERLVKAHRTEKPGKRKYILEACMRRKGEEGIRHMSREMATSYSTVRGRLLRMQDSKLERLADKRSPGKRRKLGRGTCMTISRWLSGSPLDHGYNSGTWQLDMVLELLRTKLGVECRPRTPMRTLRRLRFSYCKARPVPEKSATPEEQGVFMANTNGEVVRLEAEGYAILCEDEAAARKWNGGGYGWRRTGGRDTEQSSHSKKSVKMFGVLGKDGYRIRVADALNSETFKYFPRYLLTAYAKFVPILDNASYHRSGTVTEFVESTKGKIRLIFLPPHTPQLNPIETQWRVLKRLLACRHFETLDELQNAIKAIIRGEMKPVRLMAYLTDRYAPA